MGHKIIKEFQPFFSYISFIQRIFLAIAINRLSKEIVWKTLYGKYNRSRVLTLFTCQMFDQEINR